MSLDGARPGLPLVRWNPARMPLRSAESIHTRTPTGRLLRVRRPTSFVSCFRIPASLRCSYLQVRFKFNAQLHRTLRFAPQRNAVDDEEHLIALERVDKVRERGVASGQVRFHFDRLQSVTAIVCGLVPYLLNLHAGFGCDLAELAINLRVLGRKAILIKVRDLALRQFYFLWQVFQRRDLMSLGRQFRLELVAFQLPRLCRAYQWREIEDRRH